jgi:phenazine biosynthesis protein phzE
LGDDWHETGDLTRSEPTMSNNRSSAAIERLLAPVPPPFAVLRRPHADASAGAEVVEILFGELITVELLADLPEPARPDLPVLAVVPYRQIRERGFDAVDDGVPLIALRTRERLTMPVADLLAHLPDGPQTFTDTGYDVPDDEYEQIVRAVLDQEIAEGAGSNFVIHRCLTGRLDEPPALAALGAFKRLLTNEHHTYWTFVVHTPERTFVGASPERHVSVDAGIARMNPISGTLRYPAGGWGSTDEHRQAVLAFLADAKERDELAMVVDEELKMMAVVGDRGGRVRGPYLKEMAHLAHTEYLIEGRTSLDVRQVLTATMFAPTVTGSPIRNACRVINRHERRGRRYYAGVLALIGQDAAGRQSLDAPILIRTAEISADGYVRVAAGATLVRGSQPASELAETRAKAAAIIASLRPPNPPVIMQTSALSPPAAPEFGSLPGPLGEALGNHQGVARDPQVLRVLADRNLTLARFWLQDQAGEQTVGRTAAPASKAAVTVIDAEDDFTGMLAHQLSSLGYTVEVRPWDTLGPAETTVLTGPDLVVLGPGPGDPRDLAEPRMRLLHTVALARLAAGVPILGICLGHQLLSQVLGLRVERLALPDQGRQTGVDLFGSARRVGFYNSYAAYTPAAPTPGLRFSLEPATPNTEGRRVHALRAATATGLQFHPESVLTTEGLQILDAELTRLLTAEKATPDAVLHSH